MVTKIIVMFRQILFPLQDKSSNYGVRLEDIKHNPQEVMPQIAAWMGIDDHEGSTSPASVDYNIGAHQAQLEKSLDLIQKLLICLLDVY